MTEALRAPIWSWSRRPWGGPVFRYRGAEIRCLPDYMRAVPKSDG